MRVVVVGSGIAGLVAAIRAARRHEVLLVTKGALEEGSTRLAQGGIAAALFDDDSVEAHVSDTLAAGAGLCDEDAVRVLCEEGPQRVRDLIAFGVDFDHDPSGALARGLEAAHSAPRILHAGGDATGAAIEAALAAAVRASAVEIIEHAMLVDLVVEPTPAPLREMQVEGGPSPSTRASGIAVDADAPAFLAANPAGSRVVGVELLIGGVRRVERADAVILATGGAGQLYPHTTNPPVATGDGIAAAWRAGAQVADLEFVQFHPTALEDGFLVSEAVRGEGAVLRDAAGRRYLPAVDPRAELAPRDVVARATARMMQRQHGAPALLDATALPIDLARRFPSIDAHLRGLGLDWRREPVPVTPAAHYTMGGVAVDLHGRTSLPGLLAVGEVARTGVHGANRLASNSLLESLVFAWRAAEALTDPASPDGPVPAPSPREMQVHRALGAASAVSSSRAAADAPAFPAQTTAALGTAPASRATHLPQTGRRETQEQSGCGDSASAHPLASRRDAPAFLAGAGAGAGAGAAAAPATQAAPAPHHPTRAELQALAWRDLGLTRDGAALAAARATLAGWRCEGSTVHDLENRNLLDLARLVAEAALARTGSVGAHHRSDDAGRAEVPA